MEVNMNTRILHCGNNIENYNLCVKEKVVGFSNRGPESEDQIYLSVKIDEKSVCGVRFILEGYTDYRPWSDSEKYVNCLTIKNIEFCNPFDISQLSYVGGKYWSLKYLQASKQIKDKDAIDLLNNLFSENKSNDFYHFESTNEINEKIEIDTIESDEELESIKREIPDIKIQIMGTFQTVNFINETDKSKGLEALVNDCF
jgi:hypothetical protein